MDFNPGNPFVKLCLQGMALEDSGKLEEAANLFLQAWNEAANDSEKFISTHYLARRQKNVADRLKWLETGLRLAVQINDDSVNSALPSLYLNIAECYRELAALWKDTPSDKGPFYHGTRADLQVGDLLTAGGLSNYKSELKMNHIYFTASVNGAGLAAALAKGDGRERVYRVEPTGGFENDPNVTDKKFPGNPTRSFRSTSPLRIVGEAEDWERQTPGNLQKLREKIADNTGEIVN